VSFSAVEGVTGKGDRFSATARCCCCVGGVFSCVCEYPSLYWIDGGALRYRF